MAREQRGGRRERVEGPRFEALLKATADNTAAIAKLTEALNQQSARNARAAESLGGASLPERGDSSTHLQSAPTKAPTDTILKFRERVGGRPPSGVPEQRQLEGVASVSDASASEVLPKQPVPAVGEGGSGREAKPNESHVVGRGNKDLGAERVRQGNGRDVPPETSNMREFDEKPRNRPIIDKLWAMVPKIRFPEFKVGILAGTFGGAYVAAAGLTGLLHHLAVAKAPVWVPAAVNYGPVLGALAGGLVGYGAYKWGMFQLFKVYALRIVAKLDFRKYSFDDPDQAYGQVKDVFRFIHNTMGFEGAPFHWPGVRKFFTGEGQKHFWSSLVGHKSVYFEKLMRAIEGSAELDQKLHEIGKLLQKHVLSTGVSENLGNHLVRLARGGSFERALTDELMRATGAESKRVKGQQLTADDEKLIQFKNEYDHAMRSNSSFRASLDKFAEASQTVASRLAELERNRMGEIRKVLKEMDLNFLTKTMGLDDNERRHLEDDILRTDLPSLIKWRRSYSSSINPKHWDLDYYDLRMYYEVMVFAIKNIYEQKQVFAGAGKLTQTQIKSLFISELNGLPLQNQKIPLGGSYGTHEEYINVEALHNQLAKWANRGFTLADQLATTLMAHPKVLPVTATVGALAALSAPKIAEMYTGTTSALYQWMQPHVDNVGWYFTPGPEQYFAWGATAAGFYLLNNGGRRILGALARGVAHREARRLHAVPAHEFAES